MSLNLFISHIINNSISRDADSQLSSLSSDVKCEFMNPGGSIKDRIVLAMMNDARKEGVVTDQTEFVEATSGNTGIGLALNATLMGNDLD